MTQERRRPSGGLGRGLAALIPEMRSSVSAARDVDIDLIRPNPRQPRRSLDPEGLRELAESMTEHGVLQPVLVVETDEGYTLIAGERRWRAARQAGLSSIPAIVRTANDQESLALALVENIQRTDLNALDEAHGYRQLIDEFGLTQEEVGRRVGRSRPAISNSLRILEVAPEVQAAVADGSISGGHARALAGLDGHAQQRAVLATVVRRALSVRQTEQLVAGWREVEPAKPGVDRSSVDPDVQFMEARLREALGTKVTIRGGRRGGRITISWYDDEDLGRLVERLTMYARDGRE